MAMWNIVVKLANYDAVSINDIVIFRITNMNLGTLKLIQFKVKLTAER